MSGLHTFNKVKYKMLIVVVMCANTVATHDKLSYELPLDFVFCTNRVQHDPLNCLLHTEAKSSTPVRFPHPSPECTFVRNGRLVPQSCVGDLFMQRPS